ncbi:Copper chaperone [Mycobacterium marinum MB2]|nr:Copper chaperone [Mycobacterium marinum MB2]
MRGDHHQRLERAAVGPDRRSRAGRRRRVGGASLHRHRAHPRTGPGNAGRQRRFRRGRLVIRPRLHSRIRANSRSIAL